MIEFNIICYMLYLVYVFFTNTVRLFVTANLSGCASAAAFKCWRNAFHALLACLNYGLIDYLDINPFSVFFLLFLTQNTLYHDFVSEKMSKLSTENDGEQLNQVQLEEMFNLRYTDNDVKYMETINKPLAPPPCVRNWYSRPKRIFDFPR